MKAFSTDVVRNVVRRLGGDVVAVPSHGTRNDGATPSPPDVTAEYRQNREAVARFTAKNLERLAAPVTAKLYVVSNETTA